MAAATVVAGESNGALGDGVRAFGNATNAVLRVASDLDKTYELGWYLRAANEVALEKVMEQAPKEVQQLVTKMRNAVKEPLPPSAMHILAARLTTYRAKAMRNLQNTTARLQAPVVVAASRMQSGAAAVREGVTSGVQSGAGAATRCLETGASVVGRGVQTGAGVVSTGVQTGAGVVSTGLRRGAYATSSGVATCAAVTTRGLCSGAEAAGRGLTYGAGAVTGMVTSGVVAVKGSLTASVMCLEDGLMGTWAWTRTMVVAQRAELAAGCTAGWLWLSSSAVASSAVLVGHLEARRRATAVWCGGATERGVAVLAGRAADMHELLSAEATRKRALLVPALILAGLVLRVRSAEALACTVWTWELLVDVVALVGATVKLTIVRLLLGAVGSPLLAVA